MNTLPLQSYKKLVLYQKSKDLVINTYQITKTYPGSEVFSLVPQMRRSAVSVLANIVEGYAKESSTEYSRFLTISIGSATELEVFLEISHELGFLDKTNLDRMYILLDEVKKLLYGTRKAVRSKIASKR